MRKMLRATDTKGLSYQIIVCVSFCSSTIWSWRGAKGQLDSPTVTCDPNPPQRKSNHKWDLLNVSIRSQRSIREHINMTSEKLCYFLTKDCSKIFQNNSHPIFLSEASDAIHLILFMCFCHFFIRQLSCFHFRLILLDPTPLSLQSYEWAISEQLKSSFEMKKGGKEKKK